MAAIQLAPSAAPHGSLAARQKSTSDSAAAPGAFFALLSEVDAQSVNGIELLVPKRGELKKVGEAVDGADIFAATDGSGLSRALPGAQAGSGVGDTALLSSLSGASNDPVSAATASLSTIPLEVAASQGANANVALEVKATGGMLDGRTVGRNERSLGASAAPSTTATSVPLKAATVVASSTRNLSHQSGDARLSVAASDAAQTGFAVPAAMSEGVGSGVSLQNLSAVGPESSGARPISFQGNGALSSSAAGFAGVPPEPSSVAAPASNFGRIDPGSASVQDGSVATVFPAGSTRARLGAGSQAAGVPFAALGGSGVVTPSSLFAQLATQSSTEDAWTGAGLVAQTARIDGANTTLSEKGGALSEARPSFASRATSLKAAEKMRPVGQMAYAVGLQPSQVPTTSGGTTLRDVRSTAEIVSLQAEQHKTSEVGRAGADGALGISEPQLPLPAAASGWAPDIHRERTSFARDRLGSGSAVIGQGLGDFRASNLLDASPGQVEGTPASPEEAVADQVTYWMSENLKNAELTVDYAGQPVEVRVSLTGNEAHVAFRSDQAQTRELLDAKMDQLRELLHDQGLVLSGTSVDAGTSGQSDDASGRSTRDGTRAVSGQPAAKGPQPIERRILTSSSVDLYV